MMGPGFFEAAFARYIRWFFFIALAVLIVAGLIGYEVAIWNECRATNSFLFCLRILHS